MDEATDEHYRITFRGAKLDPYRIAERYDNITHPADHHAVKKLLRIGRKKGQPVLRDIDEVIMALVRWKEMLLEDAGCKVELTPVKSKAR